MSLYKCKCCGGDLDVHDNDRVVTCEYCGSSQTIPNEKDEQKLKLYARGNLLRNQGEFDKAYSVFSQLLNDENEDFETYWNLLLCKYGITYVDDYDGKKKPTINRMSMSSILDDEDYKKVISLADVVSRESIENDVKKIADIQTSILKIVSTEKPYDIFISYKETDEFKERTRDSLLAQEIYDTLTKDGYRVFLSRISLEKIIGKEYEPYIYSALYTSKIMLLVSTNVDYINSVWVKNEWSRFIEMMKTDKSKSLIPCYKDIDPYDLPKEIRNLQGLDMSKLGFIQDLKIGIGKIIGNKHKEEKQEKSSTKIIGGSEKDISSSLTNRGFDLLLKDKPDEANKMFNEALSYCKQSKAYLGLLCLKYNLSSIEELYSLHEDISDQPLFIQALTNASDEEKKLLENISNSLKEKKQRENQGIYNNALNLLNEKQLFDQAIHEFKKIPNFKDSLNQIKECNYLKALNLKNNGDINSFDEAINIFKNIPDYKDSNEQISECNYLKALSIKSNNNINSYDEAIKIFKKIINYKDSKSQISDCYYLKAKKLSSKNNYDEAINILNIIDKNDESYNKVLDLKNSICYKTAKGFADQTNYFAAISYLNKIEGDYKDSNELLKQYQDAYVKNQNEIAEYNRKLKIYNKYKDLKTRKNSKGDYLYDRTGDLKYKRAKLKSIAGFKDSDQKVAEINGVLYNRKFFITFIFALIIGIFLAIFIPIRQNNLKQKAYEERIAAEFKTMQDKYGAPIIDLTNEEVKYGLYPQTVINDEALLSKLNNLTDSDKHTQNDYYFYNNEYYYKRVASPYKENYKYDNGNIIQNTTYWFKCEQISWKIIDSTDDTLTLVSNKLLNRAYYSTNSRYVSSAIRSWLNGMFYQQSFALGDSQILVTHVDNSQATVDTCGSKGYTDDTDDKVYLLSYQDIKTRKYKLSNNSSDPYNTSCKTTDYIRAVGVYCDQKDGFEYCGDYWTRSCCSSSNLPSCVNSNDTINHSVKSTYGACARPVITISKTLTQDEKEQVSQKQESQRLLQTQIQAKIKEKFGTPILNSSDKTVEYGYYPQSLVDDATMIDNLNNSSIYIENNFGYTYYNDEFYLKVLASPYNEEYKFSNGETIVSTKHYWFKCESIKWRILEENDGEYKLISDLLLDKQQYHKSNSDITYSTSSIRTWLNESFYKYAFPDNTYIQQTEIGGNNDFVYLLSYNEYSTYFTNSADLSCIASDYTRAISCYLDGEYGDYWTRTFYGCTYASMTYSAYYVTSRNGGKINVDSSNGITNATNCVRPSITIKI